MKNKNEQEDVIEELPEIKEGEEDNTDWKALAKKNQGIAKRYQTKLNKFKEKKAKAKLKVKKLKPQPDKKKGFDYAEKAFLKVNDVTKDEYPLVQEIIASTGKTLDEVLESKYFRAEQKELREAKESADAVPAGTKRSGQSAKDKVEYWLAKGEMPPADQPKLRREYVNRKQKAETTGSKFTKHPVIK